MYKLQLFLNIDNLIKISGNLYQRRNLHINY